MEAKEIYVDPRHEEHSFDLPFWRDNEKLWALDVPVEEMEIEEFQWIFDIPFWEDDEGNIVLTPNEVLANLDAYPTHAHKLRMCDASFPIDIMRNRRGEWGVLDGLHRLVQLWTKGGKIVRVRKIPPELIHLTAREEETN